MKSFTSKLVFSLALLCASAFAQLGKASGDVPGRQGNSSGAVPQGVYYVCLQATSDATCIAGTTVSIFADVAGAVSISQTTGVPFGSSGTYSFYAQPGLYKVVFTYTFPAYGNQDVFVLVGADALGAINLKDGYFIIPPGACGFSSSGGTVTPATSNGILAVGASSVPVNQIATTTATETAVLSCIGSVPSRLTANKGIIINDVTLFYGNSTGNLASMATPTLGTITLPVASTSETPSTVTPVTAGGTLTITPAVASANLTALTAGAFYTEKVALATPLAINTDLTDIVFTQSFVGPTTAALTLYTGGLIVHYSIANQ